METKTHDKNMNIQSKKSEQLQFTFSYYDIKRSSSKTNSWNTAKWERDLDSRVGCLILPNFYHIKIYGRKLW